MSTLLGSTGHGGCTHLPQLLGAAAGLDGEALEHEEQAAAVYEEAERGGDADESQEDAAGDAVSLHEPPVRQHAERPQPHLLVPCDGVKDAGLLTRES